MKWPAWKYSASADYCGHANLATKISEIIVSKMQAAICEKRNGAGSMYANGLNSQLASGVACEIGDILTGIVSGSGSNQQRGLQANGVHHRRGMSGSRMRPASQPGMAAKLNAASSGEIFS
jgi:hypothetical protein